MTYDISSQTCEGAFTINTNTGVVTVADTTAIDYESSETCVITVVAESEDTSTESATFTVSITDVDDVAPVFTNTDTPSIPENQQDAITLEVTDPDSSATPTYALSGTDSELFEVSSGTLIRIFLGAELRVSDLLGQPVLSQ